MTHPVLRLVMRAFGCPPSQSLTDGEFRALRSAYASSSRPIRRTVMLRAAALARVFRLADAVVAEDARVIDVGCGYGQTAWWLARDGRRQVCGVEVSESRLQVARQIDSPNLDWRLDTAENAFRDATYDAILFIDTLLYLTKDAQRDVLRNARLSASDDCLLLIKDSTDSPAWKHGYTRFEERLKLVGGYYGSGRRTLTYCSLDEWR
ncbi:MAG: class I SAM-dependent methyltransferase, partial [Candidatus Poribacteria bacterium]|nr:class I SAM-dependent methyltransferase [Candidatus Poribacteria bacterium]